MCSLCIRIVTALFLVLPVAGAEMPIRILRITADPNNLPFSNDRLEGFENKIARLLADELKATIQYQWRAQRRGFFRESLKRGDADLVLGVPTQSGMALTTAPYYRSTYVFVSRKDRNLQLASFGDPRLCRLKVGVQLVGSDGMDTPPAHALAERGAIDNVRGFTLFGDYGHPNPPARIIDAVVDGGVDVAIVWGPLAGFFANRSKVALDLAPVTPQVDGALQFAFDISLGVTRANSLLKDQLNEVLVKRRAEIDRILDQYNIPRVERPLKSSS